MTALESSVSSTFSSSRIAGRRDRATIDGVEVKTGTFVTSDGVRLNYIERGSGKPLLMLHGWSQTSEQFRAQLAPFSTKRRVISYDHRGHGESDRPAYGYRIHRLAADLREFILGRNLKDVALLGHSMGCSVIWAYIELFGQDRLSTLVLVDEPTCLTINSKWSDAEKAAAGALFTPDGVMDLCNTLELDEGAVSDSLMDSMLTPECPAELRTWMTACNRKMPRELAARLMRDHANHDWRDVIKRITLPTLTIGAHASLAPATCMPWVAEHIPNARLEMFGASEGGSHFMFVENTAKFNALVLEFLSTKAR